MPYYPFNEPRQPKKAGWRFGKLSRFYSRRKRDEIKVKNT